jgi:transcriptional regulator with XRE-family HTH domain
MFQITPFIKVESGKIKNPTIKTIQKIAKALGISLEELLK